MERLRVLAMGAAIGVSICACSHAKPPAALPAPAASAGDVDSDDRIDPHDICPDPPTAKAAEDGCPAPREAPGSPR